MSDFANVCGERDICRDADTNHLQVNESVEGQRSVTEARLGQRTETTVSENITHRSKRNLRRK